MRGDTRANQAGFTLVELLVAMSIFSFMLLIVVSGFINVVHIHNQAVASNIAQDNARTAMDELVRAVRTSNGVLPSPTGTLCLTNVGTGEETLYYRDPANILTRVHAEGCAPPYLNPQAVTSTVVSVTAFSATVVTVGVPKPEVTLSLTVAPNNGTTQVVSGQLVCGPTNSERNFCSVITLTSGAVPR